MSIDDKNLTYSPEGYQPRPNESSKNSEIKGYQPKPSPSSSNASRPPKKP